MVKSINKGKQRQYITLLWASEGGTILVVLGYMLLTVINTGNNHQLGVLAGLVTLMGIIASIISLVAIIKVKNKSKLVPVLCLLVSLLFTSLAYFAYSFSSYGSNY